MRNNFRFLALSAAILSMFTACQREVLEQTQDIEKTTHTVTFVAGAPQTKTTVDISDETTAKFAWTSDDEDRFTVYENGVSATSTVGVLAGGKMTIMAEFEGTAPDSPSYIAIVNKSNDGQIMTSEAYDEDADILVSKEVSSFDGENGEQLQFKREVAIAKMTLKGLDASEVVNQVTVSSTADVAGNYGIEGWTSTKTSLDIYSELAMGEEGGYSIVANESGEAVVWFTCIPQDAATLTVKVEAADGDTYTKEFSKAITLTRGDVKGFGVAMAKDAKSVMDKITSDNLNLVATDTNYKDFSDVSITSMAKYAGCTSSNNGISLRTTNSNSGIVTTASGGFARKIEVDWSSSTTRTLDVYGKNTAYSNAEDLFNKDKQGTKIGSITYTSADSYETELIIEGDYPYIGLRSNNNALVLNSISIVWDNSSVSNLYSLNIIDAQGGSITASTLTADEGEEITLSATSNEGYLFQEWTVTNATTKEIIAVSDGVFTMPAANVNVSA